MDDSDRSREEPSPSGGDSADDDAASDGGGTDAGEASTGDKRDPADSEEVSADADPGSADAADPEGETDEAVEADETVEMDEASDADDIGNADAANEVAEAEEESDTEGDDDADEKDDDADEGDEANESDDADEDGGASEVFDVYDSESTQSLGDGGAPATVDDAAAAGTVEDATIADDGTDDSFEGVEAPESDEEMPLAAHIEEMMRRLAVVFLFGGLATLVVVTESTELINYFWSYHIPAPLENRPRLYGPLELPLTRLKVAGLAGVVVGLPAFVYQTYRFMKPGLYENERRYYLAAVPTSLVLGGIGIAFAHFLVLPAIFSYFTTYTSDAATIAFGLAETFNLIVIMLAFMAIVFQIPLFIMLAIMMNLVTRQWLEAKRLLFWGAFLGIAFLFSPDPTGMAPIIVTLTMITLYEGTLAILRWTGN